MSWGESILAEVQNDQTRQVGEDVDTRDPVILQIKRNQILSRFQPLHVGYIAKDGAQVCQAEHVLLRQWPDGPPQRCADNGVQVRIGDGYFLSPEQRVETGRGHDR